MTRPGSPALPRRWRNLTPTREFDPGQPRWVAALVGALLVVAAPFLAYVLVQGQTMDTRLRAEVLRGIHEKLQQAERRLHVEAARLETPARVESEARDRLGLVLPPAHRQVVVSPSPGRGGLMARAPDAPRGAARR